MTTAIELAKRCGIAYYLFPEGTTEMHGTDRQIQAFAALVIAEHDGPDLTMAYMAGAERAKTAEREACAKYLDALHEQAAGRHNYYACAARELRERSNV